MRLLTRSDFDGLVCAMLLKHKGIVDSWKFAHPKDLQDNVVEVTSNDVVANMPYVEGCGLWFDHHSSEHERAKFDNFVGESRVAPSCARVIYEYYGENEFPESFKEIMEAVDKTDSGNLTYDEIINPTGYILIGMITDPRTGLGRYHHFRISNYQMMEKMFDIFGTMPLEELLEDDDIKPRIDLYYEESRKFKDMIVKRSRLEGKLLITDLRGVSEIYAGNRFLPYALFPDANISIWLVDRKGGDGCSAAVGYSIFNRTCNIDVGSLMLKHGGGGHKAVGTCQFSKENMEVGLAKLIFEIKQLNG